MDLSNVLPLVFSSIGVIYSGYILFKNLVELGSLKRGSGKIISTVSEISNNKLEFKYIVSYLVNGKEFVSNFILDYWVPNLRVNNIVPILHKKKDVNNIYLNTYFGYWTKLYTLFQYFLISIASIIYIVYKNNNTKTDNKLTFLFLPLSFLILLYFIGIAIHEFNKTIYLFKYASKSKGKIIDYSIDKDSENTNCYYPIIEFLGFDGNVYKFQSKVGIYIKPKTGTDIMVVYNSKFPFQAEIDNNIYILAPLLFSILIIFISSGYILFTVFRK